MARATGKAERVAVLGCTGGTGAEYTADELEFARAVDAYKRRRGRPFPTCCELLAIARSLGYRKAAPAGPLPVPCKPTCADRDCQDRAGWDSREKRQQAQRVTRAV